MSNTNHLVLLCTGVVLMHVGSVAESEKGARTFFTGLFLGSVAIGLMVLGHGGGQ